MIPLKRYRSRQPGLPDLLNWASVYAPGVVLQKDGSLLAGWAYRGPDTAAASAGERNQLTSQVNAALAMLGSEWMLHAEAFRTPTSEYPDASKSYFPDRVSVGIDDERRRQFQAAGAQFETRYILFATYLPPKIATAKLAALAMDDSSQPAAERSAAANALRSFEAGLGEIEDRLSGPLGLARLLPIQVEAHGVPYQVYEGDPLLSLLREALTGESDICLRSPPVPMYIDALLGAGDFHTGLLGKLGEQFIGVVSIDGFPSATAPQMLAALDQLPMAYRWSTRFICLDAVQARSALMGFRRKWQQKVRGIMDQVASREARSGTVVDSDAAAMVDETEGAISEVASGLVGYGYYTSVLVMHRESREKLEADARLARRLLLNLGFGARFETVNTIDAFIGSLPGHAVQNVRRPLLHTIHLANLLPLSSVWPGSGEAPCPQYPVGAPPLLQAAAGTTPFRFNLHVGDIGHSLMFGPTGAGKSTALGLIAAQFRRYDGATVAVFDKGHSMEALTRAVGGDFYAVGEGALSFAPLARVDDPAEFAWAAGWVETLVELQGVAVSAGQRRELGEALGRLRESEKRTLTDLEISVQDSELKEALAAYTVTGQYGDLLDAEADGVATGTWSCFELGELMELNDRIRIPVLLYLFRAIERQAKGQPTLWIVDEAWIVLGHKVFRDKVRDWLKTARKANVAVVLATQSLSDAASSGLMDVLKESCATKIFLANPHAEDEDAAALYGTLGLIDAEIAAVRRLTPKREYFVVSEDGRRTIDFNLGPYALAFVGASSKPDVARINELVREEGEQWVDSWLAECGVR